MEINPKTSKGAHSNAVGEATTKATHNTNCGVCGFIGNKRNTKEKYKRELQQGLNVTGTYRDSI